MTVSYVIVPFNGCRTIRNCTPTLRGLVLFLSEPFVTILFVFKQIITLLFLSEPFVTVLFVTVPVLFVTVMFVTVIFAVWLSEYGDEIGQRVGGVEFTWREVLVCVSTEMHLLQPQSCIAQFLKGLVRETSRETKHKAACARDRILHVSSHFERRHTRLYVRQISVVHVSQHHQHQTHAYETNFLVLLAQTHTTMSSLNAFHARLPAPPASDTCRQNQFSCMMSADMMSADTHVGVFTPCISCKF